MMIRGKPHFLLNVVVPENTDEKPIICSLEKKSIAIEREVSWNHYCGYLKDKIIRARKPSKEEEYVSTVKIYTSGSARNFCISSNLTSSGGILLANTIDDLAYRRRLHLKFYKPSLGGRGWIAF